MRDWVSEHRTGVALALAVVLLVAAAGAVAVVGTFVLGLGSNAQTTGTAGAPDAGRAGGAGEAGVDPAAYYGTDERVVVREASMELRVEEYEPAFRTAREVAKRHGGFVAGWDRRTEGEWDRATVTLRVPAENFTAARNDLAALGTVESENVEMADRTRAFASRQARLEALRAEREELRAIMADADTVDEKLRVREEIRKIETRIRRLESDQSRLRERAALSTIELTIHEPPGRKPPANRETAFGFTDAFLGAFYGGLKVTKGAIVVVGYAIPVGLAGVLLGAFGVVCYRLWGRLKTGIDAVLLPDR